MFDKKLKMHSQILCHIADGIYFVGSNRKILYWNKGAAAITGFSAEEMIGRNCYTDMLGHEDEKGNVLCDLGCPLTVGMESGPLRRNLFLRTKDSRKILVEENISPFYQRGKLAGVVIAFREVSEFKDLRPFQLRTEKLKRLIPICGWCKKIRQAAGAWEQLEVFLSNEGFGDFTHSMCPICAEKIFTKKIYLENYQNIC